MTRYASKNLKDLKVGISSFSDNKTSLNVIGHSELDTVDASKLHILGSGDPSISSQNNLNLNAVNVAISTNATVGGDFTVNGNVSIAGTLTYEDVTNIDSIGLITARTGIDCIGVLTARTGIDCNGDFTANGDVSNFNCSVVINQTSLPVSALEVIGHTELDDLNVSGVSTFQGNVNLGDNDQIIIGDGPDLRLYHDGNNSYVEDIGTGALIIKGSTLRFRSTTNENIINASQNGKIELYFDGTKKFETTTSGIDITGHIETDTLNVSGVVTATTLNCGDFRANGDVASFDCPVVINQTSLPVSALEVIGHTDLDDLNVSGVVTATSFSGDGSGLTNLNRAAKSVVKFVATAGQTNFITPYQVGYVDVYLNGVKLTADLYTSTSGSIITLNDGAAANDIVEIISFTFLEAEDAVAIDIVNDVTPQLGGNLDLNGNDITGTGDVNISGVITATNANFSGNVSIGGTLSYVNVNDVSSIGVITAQSGIDVTGGGIHVSSGVVTATSFSGDGSNLTNVVSNLVDDTTPQLGGNLDTKNFSITSTDGLNITLVPDGNGKVVFAGVGNNGGNGAGRFKLNCEQNSHGITIQGPPHSAAANYTLTLPYDDGSAGTYLKSDGSGNLSWDTPSGGGGSSTGISTGKAIAMAMIFG